MITLSISGFSLDLKVSTSLEYPRVRPTIASLNRVATGAVVGSGTHFEPPFVWNMSVLLTNEEKSTLDIIYAEHDRLRRAIQACDVLIYDTSELYTQLMPRSRPIVPGTTETQLPIGSPTHTQYYAQFQAWFTEAPRYMPKRLDGLMGCSFTLTESEVLSN